MKTRLLAAAALLVLTASAAIADANPPAPPVVTGWSGCLTAPGRNQFQASGFANNPGAKGTNNANVSTYTYSDGGLTTSDLNADPYGTSLSFGVTQQQGTYVGSGLTSCSNPVEFATTASVNNTINNIYNDIKNITNGGGIAITPTNVSNYNGGGTQTGGSLTGAATQAAVLAGVARAQTNAVGGGTDVSNVSLLAPH